MEISDAGIALLKSLEGCVLHPYKDEAGVMTIGIGHAIKAGETFPTQISEQQAEDILRRDLASTQAWVEKVLTRTVNQNQFDALVVFTFNVGGGALQSSSLLKAVNEGNFAACPGFFGLWNKVRNAAGQLIQSPNLTRRRAKEAALFMTPVPPAGTPVDVGALMALIDQTATEAVASSVDPIGVA